jgi:hypothetical protein
VDKLEKYDDKELDNAIDNQSQRSYHWKL